MDRGLHGHGAASPPVSVLHGAAPAYAPTHPQTPMTMGGLVFGAPGPVLSMAPAAPMLAPLPLAGAVSPFATAHGGPMLHAGPPGGPMLASSAAQARALDAADGTIDGYFHGSKVCAPGMHRKEQITPPPSSRVPSLCPAAVSLTPSARLNGICNRQ